MKGQPMLFPNLGRNLFIIAFLIAGIVVYQRLALETMFAIAPLN
jgi:hypothetical protein